MKNVALEIRNLTLSYRLGFFGKKKAVLENISLCMPAGCQIALIGPNGAGKSTLVRALVGLIPTRQGTIDYGGHTLAYVPDHHNLPLFLTANQIMAYSRWCTGSGPATYERHNELIERMQLEHIMNTKVEHLSHGTKRRLAIAQALGANPDIIVLDEPFSGLDRVSQMLVQSLLHALACEGKTVIFTAHSIEDEHPDYLVEIANATVSQPLACQNFFRERETYLLHKKL